MPEEVVVAAADSEALAEVFAGRLRVEGIRSRVFYDSQVGIPPQIAPAGLGFGPGAFRVAVAERDARRARALLAPAEGGQRWRRHAAIRAIAFVLLILFLLPAVAALLRNAFGP